MKAAGLFSQAGVDLKTVRLTRIYRGRTTAHTALEEVSCRFSAGEVAVIEGPSGCGKSTLLNLIGGVDRADSGKIIMGDEEVGGAMSEAALANYRLRKVGFVFQSFNLIPGLTAIENLALPMRFAGMDRDTAHKRGEAILDLVGMSAKRANTSDDLSGGEQQRVAIALALANDPPLILADEPTGNLDSVNARRVIDLLIELAKETGKTVVVSTHDPTIAPRGDTLLRLRDGRIVDQ